MPSEVSLTNHTFTEQSDLGLPCLHNAILSEILVYEFLGHLPYNLQLTWAQFFKAYDVIS